MWHTMHSDTKSDGKPESHDPEIEQGDLIGNLVRRTDNDFRGIKDPNLIGQDIGDDKEDEDDK